MSEQEPSFESLELRVWARDELPYIPVPRGASRAEYRAHLADNDGKLTRTQRLAILAPIRLLPTELLIAILLLLLPCSLELRDPPCMLVSHEWRDLLLSTPAFWSYIALSLPENIYLRRPSQARSESLARTKRNIELSGDTPLRITTGNYISTQHGEELTDILVVLSSRCIELRTDEYCTLFCKAVASPICDFTSLKTLSITLRKLGTPHLHNAEEPAYLPSLTSLTLSSWSLPTLPPLHTPSLTHLALVRTPVRTHELVALAVAHPLLTRLTLHRISNPRISFQPISFPVLRILELTADPWVYTLPILAGSPLVRELFLGGGWTETSIVSLPPSDPFDSLVQLTVSAGPSTELVFRLGVSIQPRRISLRDKMQSWFQGLLKHAKRLSEFRFVYKMFDGDFEASKHETLWHSTTLDALLDVFVGLALDRGYPMLKRVTLERVLVDEDRWSRFLGVVLSEADERDIKLINGAAISQDPPRYFSD